MLHIYIHINITYFYAVSFFLLEHSLTLVSTDDGLTHRAKAEWSIVYMNSELADSEIWLKSALQDESEFETSRLQPIEKTYCLSVAKVFFSFKL